MKSKEKSWKQKIDPAFDELIRYYAIFLDFTELPANSGWPILEDYYLDILEKKGLKGWFENYEENIEKSKIDSGFLKDIKQTEHEAIKERDDFRKWLFNGIKALPEESQEYYKKKKIFELFYSEKIRNDYFACKIRRISNTKSALNRTSNPVEIERQIR